MNIVTLVGRLSKNIDEKTRLLSVSRVQSSEDVSNLEIPIRYWTNDTHNLLLSLDIGKLVVIRGRIDTDEKSHLLVVVEQVTIVK